MASPPNIMTNGNVLTVTVAANCEAPTVTVTPHGGSSPIPPTSTQGPVYTYQLSPGTYDITVTCGPGVFRSQVEIE
jgi:hypothetical protein